MNCLKVILAAFVCASLISAVAYPMAGELVLCKIRLIDHQKVEAAILDGDNPEALPDLFRKCKLAYTEHFRGYFNAMIQHNRIRSFAFLLSRTIFHGSEERNMALTHLLGIALRCNNIVIAEMLLAQSFQIVYKDQALFWHIPLLSNRPPLNLPLIKQFMSDHRDLAADLSPTYLDMKFVRDEQAAFILIDLALHCDIVSGRAMFDATQMLREGFICSWLSDSEMVEVSLHLLDLGAKVDLDLVSKFERTRPDHCHTHYLLRTWALENFKLNEEVDESMC